MRKWATLLLLWGMAMPAMAAKTLSIEQMEQLLFKLHGKPDGKVAGELDEVQLTERVSLARLTRWEAEFPGSKTRAQLMKLADMSAFLNPPGSDVIPDPPPDTETEERMLEIAVEYVKSTISRLPNFYATRETTHFENILSQHTNYAMGGEVGMGKALNGVAIQAAGVAVDTQFRSLHDTGEFSTTITFRDGHEVLEEDTGKRKKEEPSLGLTSHGEFGPILGAVIGDLIQTGVRWSRWEQGMSEPAAVFSFAVPANDSHFRVGIDAGGKTQEIHPAYHGEIKIDPATGGILRLSEVADMAAPYQATQFAIVVEYAPVKIGDRSYICPVRGIAYSRLPVQSAATTDQDSGPVQINLNDVAFVQYHEFGSEARIVPNAGANGGSNAGGGSETPAPGAPAGAAPADAAGPVLDAAAGSPAPGSETAPASGAAPPSAPTAAAVPQAPTPAATPPAQPAAPASSGPAAATEIAEAPAAGQAATGAAATGTVLHEQTNLVLIDVVVTDHDRPVKGLDRDRFHVYQDGKEEPIASFEEREPPASVTVAKAPELPPDTYSNIPVYPETSAVNVLLLDALNTPTSDQEQLRRMMIGYLAGIKPGTPLAIFTLSSRLRMAAGFNTDIAQLAKVIEGQKPSSSAPSSVGPGQDASLSTSLTQVASSLAVVSDPETRKLVGQVEQFAGDMKAVDSDQRVSVTLEALSELARYLAAVPGRKNLIWFSGSFPIVLGPDATMRTTMRNLSDYTGAVERTNALLTAAQVSVYPVDARGLMTSPTADATYVPPPVGGETFPRRAIANDNANFTVQTTEDQGAMKTIAEETGGHAYTTGNDLKAALDKIMATDSSYYALSYVPPEDKGGKHGGEFHTIGVKVDGAKYQLAYRRGYYADDSTKPGAGSGVLPRAMTDAALLGAPPSTQILFEARALPAGDSRIQGPVPDEGAVDAKAAAFKGGAHRYVVDLSVDPRDLTFTDEAGGAKRMQVECALVAYDNGGNPVNSLGREFKLSFPAAQYGQLQAGGSKITVRLAIDVPAGEVVLRVVVYDPASAKAGSLEVPVEAAAKQAAGN
jgi:VWFA-related protein